MFTLKSTATTLPTPDVRRYLSLKKEVLSHMHGELGGLVALKGGGFIVNGTPDYLGVDRYQSPSFVAKLIDAGSTNLWHGFPKAPADVPNPEVLNSWLQASTLRKETIKLLAQARSCSL